MIDIELKLKLAKELPELIIAKRNHVVITPQLDTVLFTWTDTRKELTEREWGWVVNQVIDKGIRSISSDENYIEKLRPLAENANTTLSKNMALLRCPWQQRAEAYFKVKS